MKKKTKKSKSKGSMNLATCSGAGRTLKKGTSAGVRKAASRKLNKCKTKK